jgi:hypothetical protein
MRQRVPRDKKALCDPAWGLWWPLVGPDAYRRWASGYWVCLGESSEAALSGPRGGVASQYMVFAWYLSGLEVMEMSWTCLP